MKKYCFLFFMLAGMLLHPAWNLYAQDTTYLPLEDMLERDFGNLQASLGAEHLLNRAVDLQKADFDRFMALNDSDFTEQDWANLVYGYNLSLAQNSLEKRDFNTINSKIFEYDYKGYVEDEIMTIPVGVVNFKGTYIPEEHFLNGRIKYQDNQFVNVQSASGDHLPYLFHLTSALPMSDIPRQKVYFVLDPAFIVVQNDRVDYVDLTVNGTVYRLYPNKKTLVDLTEAELPLHFHTVFRIGPPKDNRYQPNTKSLTSVLSEALDPTVFGVRGYKDTYTAADEPELFSIRMRYGVKFGVCNRSGKLQRPVIMVHGYRPPLQNGWPSLETLYHTKFNFKGADYGSKGFVDLLVERGYDVIICRMDPGHESIEKGGRILASFIRNKVNPEKEALGSKYETIVLGFSMGGQYWRHALMKMEKEHLYGNGANHQTRLWIPIDSPHEGANVALAHQFAAWSIHENPAGGIAINAGYDGLITDGSKDQMRYHFDGIPGNNGAPHRFHVNRTQFINILKNDFNLGTALTRYSTYPSATRNLAVAAGSNSENHYPFLNAGDVTYNEQSQFVPLIYRKKWDVQLHAARYVLGPSPNDPPPMFRRKVTFKWLLSNSTNVLVDHTYYQYNWLELDNCFASNLNLIPQIINIGLRLNSLFGSTDDAYTGNFAFIPVLSALAIHPKYWPSDVRTDLRDFGLMYNTFNLGTPSDYYGYPHLGRPSDYFKVTPMDAVFCDRESYKHIDLMDSDQSPLLHFLLGEIEPAQMSLQNQTLGKYARDNYVYKAKYTATELIRTGKDITPKTPFGWYITQPNTDLELQSAQTIEFKPGTHFQAGSKVHAYIERLCYQPKSLHTGMYDPEESDDPQASEEQPTGLRNTSLVYPNPSDGTFTVRCDALEKYGEGKLFLYNAQGRQVAVMRIRNLQTVRLDGPVAQNHLLFGRIVVNDHVLCENKIFIQR